MSTNPESLLPFDGVSSGTLRALAAAVRNGSLRPPINTFTLSMVCACPPTLAAGLQTLSEQGMAPAHLALLLETAAAVTDARLAHATAGELVWTGPESVVSHSRDTAVVVSELFARATRSVLVSTFVIQQGRQVFGPLAGRMDEVAGLSVRLFLHVGRDWKDTREESELLRGFADDFASIWPSARRPQIFYDPRSLSTDPTVRASWHAKCVVIDDEEAFVTSANFTEWAQQRNVEAGVLVRSSHFARQLRAQFDGLVQAKAVRRLPGF
ncbi:MAG: DISARM system phospholipase D-like protein DrmC [Acidobacteriota bacterium]